MKTGLASLIHRRQLAIKVDLQYSNNVQLLKRIVWILLILCGMTLETHAQSYRVDLRVGLRSRRHHMECNTRFTVYITKADGTEDKWEATIDREYNDGELATFGPKYFNYNQPIVGISISAVHQDDPSGFLAGGCMNRGGSSAATIYKESDFPCSVRRLTGFLGEYDNGSYLEIEISPTDKSITYEDPSTGSNTSLILPSEDQIKISTPPYYGGNIYWQYQTDASIGSYGWIHFPGKLQYGSSKMISGADLLGLDEFLEFVKRKEVIRLYAYYAGTHYSLGIVTPNYICGSSNILTLSPRLSAAKITTISPLTPTCNKGADGGFTLNFNRDLYPGETLELAARNRKDTFQIKNAHVNIVNKQYSFRGLPAGEYELVLIGKYPDASTATYTGTPKDSLFRTVIIPERSPVTLAVDKTRDVSCFGGGDGSFKITAGGGQGTFTAQYSKDQATWVNTPSFGSTYTPTSLSKATYQVKVKDGAGCYAIDPATMQARVQTVTINQPSSPVAMQLLGPAKHLTGYRTENGEIKLTTSGGTSAYTYTWTRSGQTLAQTSATASNLSAGKYFITVKDSKYSQATPVNASNTQGCVDTISVSLSQPDLLVALVKENKPISCYGDSDGRLVAKATGGVKSTGYTYQWEKLEGSTWLSKQSGPDSLLINQGSGSYRVRVSDVNHNTALSETFVLSQPDPLIVTGFDQQQPLCHGDDNAWTEVNVSGGTAPYSYKWYVPGTPSSKRIDKLTAGTYTVQLSDARACQTTGDVKIDQPEILAAQASIQLPSAYDAADGSISLAVSGGTSPYLYRWDYKDGTSNPFTGLPARDEAYHASVTDANACSVNVAARIIYPLEVKIRIMDSISCFGQADGRIQAIATGGVGTAYRYQWYKLENNEAVELSEQRSELSSLVSGTYRVAVRDMEDHRLTADLHFEQPDTFKVPFSVTLPSSLHAADGRVDLWPEGGTKPYSVHWDHNGSSSTTLSNLAAQDEPYTVHLRDGRGCTATVYPRLIYPIAVKLSIVDSISCAGGHDGKLQAQASGGVGNVYQYQWFRQENGTSTRLDAHSDTLFTVKAGLYKVRATDRENNSVEAELFFDEPDSLQVQLTQRNLKCKFDADAWIEASPSGGTTPYTYRWSNGTTGARSDSLIEDTYQVQVTDRRNCQIQDTTSILSPKELVISMAHQDPLGYNYTDGKVWVKAQGGTGTYRYTWLDYPETSDTLRELGHGSYTVLVHDVHNCVKQLTDTLKNPPLLEAFIERSELISCRGRSDGALRARSTGGVGSHRYQWFRLEEGQQHPQGTGMALTSLAAGVYQVRVSDDNGVSAYSEAFNLDQPELLDVTVTANSLACNGDRNGWVEAHVTGGTAPYAYLWTTGDGTRRVDDLTDDKYFVFVSDARGCEAKAQGEITVPGGIVVENIGKSPTCHNDDNGFIQLLVQGGVAPYTFRWDDGDRTSLRNNLPAGDYRVLVTDAKGCFRDIRYRLDNPPAIPVDLGPDKTLCKGQVLELNASLSDDPQAQYRWYKDTKFFSSQAQVQLQDPGQYKVQVRDGKGCEGEGNIRISRSGDDISANFAMAAKAPQGQAVRIVNASYPTPERVEWIIPEDASIEVIHRDDTQAELVFNRKGSYTIGIRSGQGLCEQTQYKSIAIVDKSELDDETPSEPFLKQFLVYPNPADGQFTVKIELSEKADIRLRLVNLGGALVDDRKVSGAQYYEVAYKVSNHSGVHVLQLLSSKANSSIKIVLY